MDAVLLIIDEETASLLTADVELVSRQLMSVRIPLNSAESKSKGKARATVGDELPASAANIPPELVERILYFYTAHD